MSTQSHPSSAKVEIKFLIKFLKMDFFVILNGPPCFG